MTMTMEWRAVATQPLTSKFGAYSSHELGLFQYPFTVFRDDFFTITMFADYKWVSPFAWPTDVYIVILFVLDVDYSSGMHNAFPLQLLRSYERSLRRRTVCLLHILGSPHTRTFLILDVLLSRLHTIRNLGVTCISPSSLHSAEHTERSDVLDLEQFIEDVHQLMS